MTMQVELVSPERILWSGDADMVLARTTDGEIAFLSGHAPFVGALGIGRVVIRPTGGGPDEVAAVHGGFVEVKADKVTILSDVSELAGAIDVDRARAAEGRAQEALRNVGDGDEGDEQRAALQRAQVRLAVADAAALSR